MIIFIQLKVILYLIFYSHKFNEIAQIMFKICNFII